MRYVHGNRGGVVSGGLAVTQNGTPNMSVNVADGMVLVPGTENSVQGTYVVENIGALNVLIAAADPTNPRRDLIIARVRDAIYSGASNTATIEAVTGTPAASPADPALPAGSCWVIARVAVAAAAASITNANLTRFAEGGTGYTGQNGAAVTLGGIVPATSATRPITGAYEGMVAYETDTNRMAAYDGAAWGQFAAGFHSTVASYVTTTGFVTTGASFSLPAGNWILTGKCEAANLAAAAGQTLSLQLFNSTGAAALDQCDTFFAAAQLDRRCLTVAGFLTNSAAATVQLRGMSNTGGANYPLERIRLVAVGVTAVN
jgi:hypothetical protein